MVQGVRWRSSDFTPRIVTDLVHFSAAKLRWLYFLLRIELDQKKKSTEKKGLKVFNRDKGLFPSHTEPSHDSTEIKIIDQRLPHGVVGPIEADSLALDPCLNDSIQLVVFMCQTCTNSPGQTTQG
jgi:hypothetical protein